MTHPSPNIPRRRFLGLAAFTALAAALGPRLGKAAYAPVKSAAPSPRTAILVFEGAEELDVFGPLAVFATANESSMRRGSVYLLGKGKEPVQLAHGSSVTPQFGEVDAPPPEYLIVPGGIGVKEGMDDPDLLRVISKSARSAQWIGSVGSGTLLVAMAGPGIGKRMTTHPNWSDRLRRVNQPELVVEGVRFLWDEPVASASGSAAGIEMALWMTGRAYTDETPERVAKALGYVAPGK